MARADLHRARAWASRRLAGQRLQGATWRPVALAAACALLPSLPLAAWAQHAPAGSPTDVRYTAITAGNARLYPALPGDAVTQAARLRFDLGDGAPVLMAGGVDQIVVDVDGDGSPADGQTPVKVTVRLFDRNRRPVTQATTVTIEHSGGRLKLPGARTDELGPRGLDADRAAPGVQLAVTGGVAEFHLLAPAEAQDVRLRVSTGGQEVGGTVSFVPEMRPMIAAGLLEGVVHFRNKVGLSPARRGDAFEQEIESWSRQFRDGKSEVSARAAFALKGTIRGDLLLTAAYDSDKATRARLLRDIRPDELYPVYGDASLRSFDARSGDRLYVRIDRNKSYLLYGDFATGDGFSQPLGQGAVASLKQRSLGAYNRTATGLRLHHEASGLVGNVFAINDTLRTVVEEFPSQGSGPYGLRHNAVLEGSDKIEVIVRDRHQPSHIVSVRPLQRLIDYSFEPFSGRILLASFLPSVDDSLNPVSLRVSYEVDQGGEAFWVGGGDVQARLGDKLEIGGSLVDDRNALAPYRLLSGNLTLKLDARTAVVVEVAQSTSTVNTNPANQHTSPGLSGAVGEVEGRAARVELAHEGERTQARLLASRSSPVFNNPSAPLAGGRDELLAQGSLRVGEGLKLYAEAAHSENRMAGGGEKQAAALGAQWQPAERLTLDASLRHLRETVGTGTTALNSPFGLTSGLTGSIATGSAGGAVGFGQAALDPATGLPVITQAGLPASASSLPAGTRLDSQLLRLGAGYRWDERLRLGAELEADISGDERRRLSLGADYALNRHARLYGRAEHQSGWVQLNGVSDTGRSADLGVVGVEANVLRETQVFSEGRLRDAFSGRDLQMASGVRHAWTLAEGLRANVALERVKVLSGQTGSANALSLGVDYSAHPLWRGSTRLEWRRSGDGPGTVANDAFDTTLWQLMAARKLDRNWTLLARNYLLMTDYAARGDVLQDRAQLGLAYRDTDTNRINALGKVELKLERDASNAAVGTLSTRALIASGHADWHPSRPWWLTGRVAGKWQRDVFESGVSSPFKAALIGARAVYDITENWDVGVMAALQLGQGGARQHALGVEAGYLLRQNLWLSAGFNATGFAGDRDLVGYEYTQSGVYLRLRFKFDEKLFKSGDREVNRSLDR